MKILNILGLIIFVGGALAIMGFGLFEFFKDSNVPLIIKIGIVALVIGAIIIFFSLIKERIKDKKEEKL